LILTLGFAMAGHSAASVLPRVLAIQGVAPLVSMLPVHPGVEVALRARDPERGDAMDVDWSASGGAVTYRDGVARWHAPDEPGAYRLVGTAERDGVRYHRSLTAFVTVPTAEARDGQVAGYHVGRYPALYRAVSHHDEDEHGLPGGFIRLDAESARMPVSRSFTLGQFAVKDGARREKYMFLSPRLIEKLERVIDELNAAGYHARGLRIMSGYRTPAYNEGIGNKTTLSRHTYGDAADVLADDWDGDGRITEKDARILYDIADRLDRTTNLTGGLSLYHPTASHGWFVHIDARGHLARW